MLEHLCVTDIGLVHVEGLGIYQMLIKGLSCYSSSVEMTLQHSECIRSERIPVKNNDLNTTLEQQQEIIEKQITGFTLSDLNFVIKFELHH